MADEEWPLDLYLAWTISVVDKDGWLPRKWAKDHRVTVKPTMNKVLDLLSTPKHYENFPELVEQWHKLREAYRPTPAQEKKARAVIRWARNLTDADVAANSFLRNVRTVARSGVVGRNCAGVAATLYHACRERLKNVT